MPGVVIITNTRNQTTPTITIITNHTALLAVAVAVAVTCSTSNSTIPFPLRPPFRLPLGEGKGNPLIRWRVPCVS